MLLICMRELFGRGYDGSVLQVFSALLGGDIHCGLSPHLPLGIPVEKAFPYRLLGISRYYHGLYS